MTKERHKSRLKRIFLTTVFLTRFLSLGHRNKETILRKKQVRESPQCFVTTNRARHHGPATLEKKIGANTKFNVSKMISDHCPILNSSNQFMLK